MRNLILTLAALISASAFGFGSGPAPAIFAPGKVVYNNVVLHAERKGDALKMYSTNYIALDTVIPVGTKLTVSTSDDDEVRFVREKGEPLEIEFVEKHNRVPFTDWANKNFSEKAVSLPGGLSDKEKKAIEDGRIELGMSRKAVFLAIGFPPKSLTADEEGRLLKYQKKRFNHVNLTFDDKGQLIDIKD